MIELYAPLKDRAIDHCGLFWRVMREPLAFVILKVKPFLDYETKIPQADPLASTDEMSIFDLLFISGRRTVLAN